MPQDPRVNIKTTTRNETPLQAHHRKVRRRIFLTAAAIIALSLGCLAIIAATEAGAKPTPTLTGATRTAHHHAGCGQEDSPTWVWSKCGNRKRGVMVAYRTAHGVAYKRLIVGPCGYRRLSTRHLVSRVTPRLRGDWWAIHHGCGRA